MNFKNLIFVVLCVAKKNKISPRQALAHVVYRISIHASAQEIEGLKDILFLVDEIFKSVAGGASLPFLLLTYAPRLKSIDTTLLKRWEKVVAGALDKVTAANYEIKLREF